jgi:hypothetical protein
MSTEQTTFRLQLQALGRILDRRLTPAKELCILQTGDGFVVHMLEATSASAGPAFAPTTVVVESDELKAEVEELLQPLVRRHRYRRALQDAVRAAPSEQQDAPLPTNVKTGGLKWWRKR